MKTKTIAPVAPQKAPSLTPTKTANRVGTTVTKGTQNTDKVSNMGEPRS